MLPLQYIGISVNLKSQLRFSIAGAGYNFYLV